MRTISNTVLDIPLFEPFRRYLRWHPLRFPLELTHYSFTFSQLTVAASIKFTTITRRQFCYSQSAALRISRESWPGGTVGLDLFSAIELDYAFHRVAFFQRDVRIRQKWWHSFPHRNLQFLRTRSSCLFWVDSATSPLLFHADNDDRKNANYASASNEVPSALGKLPVDSSAFMDQLFSDFRLYFVAFEDIMGMTKKQWMDSNLPHMEKPKLQS